MRMRLPLVLFAFLFSAAPAPTRAQNVWPVSFSYWFGCPDRYLPDLHAADHSIASARSMAGLDDQQLGALIQHRTQAMVRRELAIYHAPTMLLPPETASARTPGSSMAEPAPESSAPTSLPALPVPSSSPFPTTVPRPGERD